MINKIVDYKIYLDLQLLYETVTVLEKLFEENLPLVIRIFLKIIIKNIKIKKLKDNI